MHRIESLPIVDCEGASTLSLKFLQRLLVLLLDRNEGQ